MPRSFHREQNRRPSIFGRPNHRVPGEGPKPARIMLIGERPGEQEAAAARPFVGITGEFVNIYMQVAGLVRALIYITNLVKTFREYQKPTKEEIAADWYELMAEIYDVQPDIIGVMGTYAVEALLGRKAEMEKTHGVPEIWANAWKAGISKRTIVLPMIHPAAGIYSPDTMPAILDDWLQLARLADGEISVRHDQFEGKEDYSECLSNETRTAEWLSSMDRAKVSAIDTEGTMRYPWCATVSIQPGSSRLFRPQNAFLLNLPPKVYLHNSLHDLGVLRTMGLKLEDNQFVDTMVLAYKLCIEPQGLKPLFYRHCGGHQDSYADILGEAEKLKAMEWLRNAALLEYPDPDMVIETKGGKAKARKPQNVGRRIRNILKDVDAGKLDKEGNPTDPRARWRKVEHVLREQVESVWGEMPTATLDDVDPEKAIRYANRDADATLRIGPILEARIREMKLERAVEVDHGILPMIDRMQEVGIGLADIPFWEAIEDKCVKQMGRAKYAIFQATGQELNPASGDQMAKLLYEDMGLDAPMMTDTGERGSVKAVALEMLLGQAPIVQHIMDYTEANKIKGTYAVPLRYLRSKGERAHSDMRITTTTTGRLSMADPPLHQIPILSDLGKELRAGFVPRDGYIFGDWDLDQIEMRLMAHESQDPELCQLFINKRDIHSETACKIFSVPMSQLSVGPTGKVNDYRRTVAKHAGFGIINGITEHGLVNYMILNRCRRPDGEAWTLDDCVMLLKAWFDIYKGVKRFQLNCIAEAQSTGLSRESISGAIVYLPAVWSPIKRIRERAERMSYVQHTQGGAAALMKIGMKRVWEWVCKDHELQTDPLLWVHDENLMELPDKPDIKKAVDILMVEALTGGVKLRVPVLASGGYGYNWLEAH